MLRFMPDPSPQPPRSVTMSDRRIGSRGLGCSTLSDANRFPRIPKRKAFSHTGARHDGPNFPFFSLHALSRDANRDGAGSSSEGAKSRSGEFLGPPVGFPCMRGGIWPGILENGLRFRNWSPSPYAATPSALRRSRNSGDPGLQTSITIGRRNEDGTPPVSMCT